MTTRVRLQVVVRALSAVLQPLKAAFDGIIKADRP